MNIRINIQPQHLFVIIGLVYGVAIILVVPPFGAPDEYEHFDRAYSLSNGHLIPEKIGKKAGVYVPIDVIKTEEFIQKKWKFIVRKKVKINISLFNESFIDNDKEIFVDISKIAVVTYSPLPYSMSALIIAIGNVFNLSPLILLYISRFVNLILFLFLIYLSIKITPTFKWGFLAVALMPMTLFESASVSADGLTIGLSFIIIALFLRYSLDDKIKKINLKNIMFLYLVILALSLAKLPYFLLIFLFFMIPANKFGNNKKKITIFSLLFLASTVVVIVWILVTMGLYMPGNNISIYNQFLYILPRPFLFLQLIWKSLVTNPLRYFKIVVGTMWWSYPLPKWVYFANILILLGLPLLDKNKIKINYHKRLIIIGTFLLIAALIFLMEYLTWNSVASKIINGVQGRYFIPILPLLFLIFHNNKLKFKDNVLKLILIASLVLILLIFISCFIVTFYV